jgi:hypothetical protein
MRAPDRPSRPKTISMSSIRRMSGPCAVGLRVRGDFSPRAASWRRPHGPAGHIDAAGLMRSRSNCSVLPQSCARKCQAGPLRSYSRWPLSDWLHRREQKCRLAKRPFRMQRPRARSGPCAADARDPPDCWRASHAPSRRGVHPRCRDGRFRIGAKGPLRGADLRRQWALRSERWPDHRDPLG